MKISAILLDVDGTLTDSRKQIAPRTEQALKQAQETGAKLVLASGRPVSGLRDFASQLEMDRHNGLLCAYNGARIVDCQTGKTLFENPIPKEEARHVLEHLKQFDVIPMVEKEGYMHVNDVFADPIIRDGKPWNIIEYEARGGKFKLCEQEDLARFADFDMPKILTAAQPAYLQEHAQQMVEPFKDTLTAAFTAPWYFEYTAKGVDKASALKTVLDSLDIPLEETVAFGDAQNDLSMLELAGLGVAMGNADEAVKAAADAVTDTNDNDGIAKKLEELL